jgi:hypothetical protein
VAQCEAAQFAQLELHKQATLLAAGQRVAGRDPLKNTPTSYNFRYLELFAAIRTQAYTMD